MEEAVRKHRLIFRSRAAADVAWAALRREPTAADLLFVYVFDGTLGAGLGGPSGGRAEYADYVTPGILLITVASVAQGTAISVAMDMTSGIIAWFRTMAISLSCPLDLPTRVR